MPLSRRQFHRYCLATLALATLPAHAAPLNEGSDWAPIAPPQPGASPGRIEVLEFFSYGCPHCREFHPLISNWAAKLPKDIAFKRVPVSFGRAAWRNLAKLYYALEASGDLARLDQVLFDAIHNQRVNLFTDKAIMEWLAGQKVDVTRIGNAYTGFSVQTQLARSEQLVRLYKVDSVPRITVDGRYAVLGRGARKLSDHLTIADALIGMARRKHPRAKPAG